MAASSPRAALDGVSALGVVGFTERQVHVTVPKSGRVAKSPMVRGHYRREWQESDVITLREMRLIVPETAAVRGALWQPSDRAAATLLSMVVQQLLVNLSRLVEASDQLSGRGRAHRVQGFVADIADGARSLGELDFAALCAAYGLPAPKRQVVVRRPNGSAHLDVRWEDRAVTVEIDGSQHFAAQNALADLLRHNDVALTGDVLLRIPLLGLRVAEQEFMGQGGQSSGNVRATASRAARWHGHQLRSYFLP